MTLFVIVKGNRFEAARSMADAGIGFAFDCETGYGKTVGRVGDHREEDIHTLYHAIKLSSLFPIGAVMGWSKK